MKQAIKRLSILVFALIFSGMILPCLAQTKAKDDLVEIYDGADPSVITKLFPNSTMNVTDEDKVLVGNLIKDQKIKIRQQAEEFANGKCSLNFRADTVLEGSFTKPDSSQKAYSYSVACGKSILSDQIYGLMVVENDKVVFNRFHSIFRHGLKILPDINKNGLSEIAITWSSQLTDHFYYTTLKIVECKSDDTFVDLGQTQSSSSGIWLGESKYHKIFVKPSADPIFFRETYEPKDKKWVLTKELEEFKLDK